MDMAKGKNGGSKGLQGYINSQYFEAANALKSKRARRRIVAYVESYDDIYFWRTVLSEFENDKRYFEVMLPSKTGLSRGKKSVLMNFLEGEPLGRDMIACVDADFDYLLQGATAQSQKVLESPYVFHTYVYAIENYHSVGSARSCSPFSFGLSCFTGMATIRNSQSQISTESLTQEVLHLPILNPLWRISSERCVPVSVSCSAYSQTRKKSISRRRMT